MLAYLILAHGNPVHLQRLINRLRSDETAFFLHVDRKSDARAFAHLAADDVTLLPAPVAVHWGDFSQVEAILMLMKTALAAGNVERLVLLSGVDYPLWPTADIKTFFASSPTAEYINMVPMPCAAAGKPLARLSVYTLRPTLSTLHRLALRILLKAGVMPRQRDYERALGSLKPYGGSTWWALTRPACEYVVDFVDRNPALVRFFKGTQYADETLLHTILGNSPLKAHVERNLTYTDWSAGGASPANMSSRHIAHFETNKQFGADDVYGSGPMIFARKFSDHDNELLQAMDTRLAHAEPALRS